MKLAAAFSILSYLSAALSAGFRPTFQTVIRSPSLLFKPSALSKVFFGNLWIPYGNGVDGRSRAIKSHLISPNAYGVVLDIGAGHGHTARYLDPGRVTKYIALEPNTHMHLLLRSAANAAGFHEANGTLLILSYGAQDTTAILSAIGSGKMSTVDTLISILTLCTVPSPRQTASSLVRDVLTPGGYLLFYEHVLSHRSDVAWWQRFWTPLWRMIMDGCRLDRPTHLWLKGLSNDRGQSLWAETEMWGKEGAKYEENLFWNRIGKFIKRELHEQTGDVCYASRSDTRYMCPTYGGLGG